jgi:hypothetical protein
MKVGTGYELKILGVLFIPFLSSYPVSGSFLWKKWKLKIFLE